MALEAAEGVAPAIVGLPMAAALGLMFGLGPCLVSCLPFLGPVFLCAEGGVARGFRLILPHVLGRLFGYGGLAALAGFAGDFAATRFDPRLVNTVLGSATLLVGLAILAMSRMRRRRACGAPCGAGSPEMETARQFLPSGLFLMGLGMAFTPCAPLSVVLFSSATAGDWKAGLALGLAFGLGAIVAPWLFYGVGFAYFATRLRARLGAWLGRVEALSGVMLTTLGLVTLFR